MEPVIEIRDLVRRYGRQEAVNGLNLDVAPGRCYGFFGRNGAGKTTTIKCLLNLLRRDTGGIRLFGMDPVRDEVAVKRRLTYVPDQVAFHPWMTIRDWFDYLAAFRERWNTEKEQELLRRYELDAQRSVNRLSRGERMQVALIGAVCPEPELLILDEPTSGLDPLVRREFIRTVIGAYQEGDPANRTVFVSTHLITEFEGLIDEFTIIDRGQEVLSLESETARERFVRIRARFTEPAPALEIPEALTIRRDGREAEVVVNGAHDRVVAQIEALQPEEMAREALSLEEIFLATVAKPRAAA